MPHRSPLLIASIAAAAVSLSACSSLGGAGINQGGYSLVRQRPISVGNDTLVVTPPHEWNRIWARLFVDIGEVEDWTLNGPYLDGITYVTGLKNGTFIVRQDKREYRQVPKYRSNMTAPEITSMLESLFRVRGGAADFKTLNLSPRPFLGTNGFQFDFEHLDGDEVWRKGRAVGATIDGRLYMILLDAARSHYYAAALPDYEAIVASARLKR
ncbi:MAG: hypothetical protein ABIT69_04470 [Sphingomicrobium sp.]